MYHTDRPIVPVRSTNDDESAKTTKVQVTKRTEVGPNVPGGKNPPPRPPGPPVVPKTDKGQGKSKRYENMIKHIIIYAL